MNTRSYFDTYIGIALEYDIFAGGDPNRPKSDRYTTQTAQMADQGAIAEKNAIDQGEQPDQNMNNTQDMNEGNDSQQMGADDGSNLDMPGGDDMGVDDNLGGDEFGDGTGGTDEMGDMNSTDSMGDTSNENDPQALLDKKRNDTLFTMITSLHRAIDSNLNTMKEINPPSDEEANKLFFDTQNQLEYCKNLLFEIATQDLGNKEYVDILRRVTTISKVYELSIHIMEKIFPKK